MNREEEIRKRLDDLSKAGFEDWTKAKIALSEHAPNDLRYLLEKVERLERELATASTKAEMDAIPVGESRVIRVEMHNRGEIQVLPLSDEDIAEFGLTASDLIGGEG